MENIRRKPVPSSWQESTSQDYHQVQTNENPYSIVDDIQQTHTPPRLYSPLDRISLQQYDSVNIAPEFRGLSYNVPQFGHTEQGTARDSMVQPMFPSSATHREDPNSATVHDIEAISTASSYEVLPSQPKALPPSSEPPNGGLFAWLQVVGAFFLFFNSWGLVNTFGVFQELYHETLLSSFQPSAISWIGTVQGFLLIVVGILSGPLYDLGYLRGLMSLGTALIFLGLLIVAEVREYFGIFLSLSLLVGIGAGCLFVPSVAIVAQYFTTKRPFATGIAAAGGSFGGVIFPIVLKRAIDSIGYSWACRVLAFMVLGTQILPLVVLKGRVAPTGKARTLLDLNAFHDPAFTLFSFALFLTFIGLYIPFFYVPSYATSKLDIDSSFAFYLLSILNTGSFFGRIIPNLIANYAGSLPVLLLCTFSTGILIFFWIPVRDLAALVCFGVLYGFFSGAVVSLPPTALIALSPDLSKVGTRLGMSFSFAGFGLLVGNPIAGALLQTQFSFTAVQVFSGVVVMAGFVLMGAAMLVHSVRSAKAGGEK